MAGRAAVKSRLLPSLGRWLVAAAAALAVLVTLNWVASSREQARRDQATEQALRVTTSGTPADHAAAIRRIDVYLGQARARAAAAPDEWPMHERVAQLLLDRARLTGSYDEYQAAEAALDRAFAVAMPGSGPHATRAVLDFTMHRLAAANGQLALIEDYAVPPTAPERAELTAMRGDILFYSGDYAGALQAYDAADAIVSGAAEFRRAIYHSRTGQPDQAEIHFDRAERGDRLASRQSRGYYELQRGILDLDRGRLAQALDHFRRADALFPGYWLIEEHIAEVTALAGDPAGAAARYRAIVARTGRPEFMDALAELEAGAGNARAANAWRERAGAAWRARLLRFPEATYAHALDHCIGKGDWACALALAQRNHNARPHGDAKIALAEALLRSGHGTEASIVIESVLSSPWRTARLHAVAARVYDALGRRDAADAQRRLALQFNPRAPQMFAEAFAARR